ncbi:MAG: UDPGP type 1 family protein [Planctomycetota bacterium]
MSELNDRYQAQLQRLNRHGQAHLLAFWDALSDTERGFLLNDIEQIDLEVCQSLVKQYVLRKPRIKLPDRLEPAPILPATPDSERADMYRHAFDAGCEAIQAGQVAAFTVAGGQGTRLGFDGPKGAYPTSPIRGATLFQLFAEALLGIERRLGRRPRWYIMTSPANHADSVSFFESHEYWGLQPEEVIFFPQGQMPAFHPDGRIALSAPHRVALAPDGHGGSLRALAASGALDEMRTAGIDYLSYFQVDNPLVKAVDPLFIGLHILHDSELSTKAVTKADDIERVGNICLADGHLTVIEYSDLPDELAHARDAGGQRRFDAGNIAIHLLSREFIERVTAIDSSCQLPWHRADKKVAVLNHDGQLITPDTPNVVKLEMFVFDAIALARNPLVVYTERGEEFSPIKNAEGTDSVATARRDQIRRAARWLEIAGVTIRYDQAGEPDPPMEISPTFALDAQDLSAQLSNIPVHEADRPLLLA